MSILFAVRLGNSGLKVSRIILGTALWGNPKFLPWATIDEEAATAQVKLAYVLLPPLPLTKVYTLAHWHVYSYENGIQTFDTANVSGPPAPPE